MLLPTLLLLASIPALQPMNLFQGLFPTLPPFPVVETAARTPATNSEQVQRSVDQSVRPDATPVLQHGNITIAGNGDINVQAPVDAKKFNSPLKPVMSITMYYWFAHTCGPQL
jgi:hypothetical protein